MGNTTTVSESTNTDMISGSTLEPADFVHLHNHTHHSVLDGMTKIPDLVGKIKEMGMSSVAVTDHAPQSNHRRT